MKVFLMACLRRYSWFLSHDLSFTLMKLSHLNEQTLSTEEDHEMCLKASEVI